jgi:RHS repeat-associated protein
LLRRYIYGLGRISMTSGGSDFFYHYDTLGSVSNVTSAASATEWTYAYEPYGAPRTTTQNDPLAPANPQQFTGEYLDDASATYYLRARDYDTTTGRFLGLDPLERTIGDPAVSGYVYADDLPTALIDPSGMGAIWSNGGKGCPHSWTLRCLAMGIAVTQFGWHPGCERSSFCLAKSGALALSWVMPWGRVAKFVGEASHLAGAAREGSSVFRGGLYKDLDAAQGVERHHMIADSVSPVSHGKGPSIQMETANHQMTASWGNSAAARAYRAQQAAMVAKRDTAGALQLDILNVRGLFGTKYDRAIQEMLGAIK